MSDASLISDRVAPHSIRYSQMTPLSFEGKQSTKYFYTSNQSSYQPGAVIRIPISSGNAFLDGGNSFLKMTFTNNNGDAAGIYTFANSFHSLVDRVRVLSSGGQELENIMQYNHLHGCLSDLLLSPEKRMTRLQEGYGTVGTPTFVVPVVGGAANPAHTDVELGIAAALATLKTTSPLQVGCDEVKVAQNGSVTIYLPLELSQLVGANKKLLPLFLTGELTLEITLAQQPCALAVANAQAFTVSNVMYCASMVEFTGAVNSSLTAMCAQSGLFLHATCWSNQVMSLAAGVGQWVNAERLKSVKSVLIAFTRPLTGAVNERITNRITNTLTSLQLKIGSDFYPTQPISAVAAAPGDCGHYLNETYKALGVYNDAQHSGMVNVYNFASSVASASAVGRAVYGIDLDAVRGDVESGINTIISNPMTFIAQGTGLAACDVRTFLYHDCIFQIRPDGQFVAVR